MNRKQRRAAKVEPKVKMDIGVTQGVKDFFGSDELGLKGAVTFAMEDLFAEAKKRRERGEPRPATATVEGEEVILSQHHLKDNLGSSIELWLATNPDTYRVTVYLPSELKEDGII
jgi:hypothetical protein